MGFYTASSFSDALGKLPKEIREKVGSAQTKFDSDRNQPGLNFEKIRAADNDIYSIRVNDDYRIICKCPNANTDIFLYVDKHDDAYQWARTHTCAEDVNGNMAVYTATAPRITSEGGRPRSRLSVFSDQDFESIGVPSEFRDQLRNKVFTKNQLIGFNGFVSDATYLVLEHVLEGGTKEDALVFYDEMASPVIPVPAIQDPPLFDYPETDLAHIGVPVDLIDILRQCRTKDEFFHIQDKFPENALQSLYAILDGTPLEEIQKKKAAESKDIKSNDIASVLSSKGTKQCIIEIKSFDEFVKLLEAPMEKWRTFLHPDQRQIVEANYGGPARVIGGAGTGKTVIVVHRAKELAAKCNDSERVLVTTYSRTLADDIQARLQSICTEKELSRIDVNTLNSIAGNMIRSLVVYDRVLTKAWAKAISEEKYYTFDESFYISEWRDVIQAQQIQSRQEYLTALRTGRGDHRVDKAARDRIYSVMECYRDYMTGKRCIDIDWAENECAEMLESSGVPTYKHILVDECQDFSAPALRLIRALAGEEHPNDLFLSGDARQRIYSGKTTLSSCGIYVRNRSTQLMVNYRTTREINELSLKLQKGYNYDDLDNNPTSKDANTSIRHGDEPTIRFFETKSDESSAVIKEIKKDLDRGIPSSGICIVARTNRICDYYNRELLEHGLETLRLLQNQPDDRLISGVRISTMHRVKGMEFDIIYAVSVNDGIMPFGQEYNDPNKDAIAKEDVRKKDANLLAVSITRARKQAWISSYGKPSILLDKLTD